MTCPHPETSGARPPLPGEGHRAQEVYTSQCGFEKSSVVESCLKEENLARDLIIRFRSGLLYL